MSRIDGVYPKFHRVEADEHEWPDHYWDSSRRCGTCERKLPDQPLFNICPICRTQTNRNQDPPDMRWPDALYLMKEAAFEKFYDEWNDGVTDEQLVWEEVTTAGELDDDKISLAVEGFIDESINPKEPNALSGSSPRPQEAE